MDPVFEIDVCVDPVFEIDVCVDPVFEVESVWTLSLRLSLSGPCL